MEKKKSASKTPSQLLLMKNSSLLGSESMKGDSTNNPRSRSPNSTVINPGMKEHF
jgi:hypothetical protein